MVVKTLGQKDSFQWLAILIDYYKVHGKIGVVGNRLRTRYGCGQYATPHD